MTIAANKAVSIDYTLTNDAGEVIDSSAGGAPLVYLQGAGNIIPGLENALVGKSVGDELTVVVEPENAYGEYSAELAKCRSSLSVTWTATTSPSTVTTPWQASA